MRKQDTTLHIDIAQRLRYHRTRLSFTVERLAEEIDVTPRYLQDLERGKVGASLTTLRDLCQILEISTDALLFGEPAGIDALLRKVERKKVEQIEKLVRLQLEIMES